MRHRIEYVLTLAAQLIGSAVLLLLTTRTWDTIVTERPPPFPADQLAVTGREIDSAPTALALVGLAGVVAVLATRGVLRRAVGVLVLLAGAIAAWRSAAAGGSLDRAAALALVRSKHPDSSVATSATPVITSHALPAVGCVLAAVLLSVAGVVIALRSGQWSALSVRYENPAGERLTSGSEVPESAPDEEDDAARARAQAAIWNALDRGEDPTNPREQRT